MVQEGFVLSKTKTKTKDQSQTRPRPKTMPGNVPIPELQYGEDQWLVAVTGVREGDPAGAILQAGAQCQPGCSP